MGFFPILPLLLERGQVNNTFQIDKAKPAPLALHHMGSHLVPLIPSGQ